MASVDLCWKAANHLRTLALDVAPGDPNLHEFFVAVAAWLDREGNQTLRAVGNMNGAADPQAMRVAEAFLQCMDPKPADEIDDQRHRYLLPEALCEWCDKPDLDGAHENGCRLGLGPDEVDYECPACTHVAPWTDGEAVSAGQDSDTFWCQWCAAVTALEDCRVVPSQTSRAPELKTEVYRGKG